jgi:hypothetical protein
MRQTMLLPIILLGVGALSCLAIKGRGGGQDRTAAPGVEAGQMAGTISSPGSSGSRGNSPGSSSGSAS